MSLSVEQDVAPRAVVSDAVAYRALTRKECASYDLWGDHAKIACARIVDVIGSHDSNVADRPGMVSATEFSYPYDTEYAVKSEPSAARGRLRPETVKHGQPTYNSSDRRSCDQLACCS